MARLVSIPTMLNAGTLHVEFVIDVDNARSVEEGGEIDRGGFARCLNQVEILLSVMRLGSNHGFFFRNFEIQSGRCGAPWYNTFLSNEEYDVQAHVNMSIPALRGWIREL